MSRHSDLGIGEIHSLFNWIWENDTARLAQVIEVDDINKAGFVTATQVAYLLTDITPTWVGFLTTGGGININDLGDVTITTPVDGEALVYSGGVWINGTGVSALTDLSDVIITTPLLGETLSYDGTDWVNLAGSTGNTHTEEDAATNTVTDVVTLSHNTTGVPVAGFGTGIKFQAESDTTQDQDIGGIEFIYTDPTNITRTSQIRFHIIQNGALNEIGVLTGKDIVSIDGNTRGENSIEFQGTRQNATQVASGEHSALIGGRWNTADGYQSVVIGGRQNIASNANSVAIGGDGCAATGQSSFVGTANVSTSSGLYSVILSGGSNNNAGAYSNLLNGYNNTITTGTYNSIINGGNITISGGNHGFIGSGNDNIISSPTGHNTILNGGNNIISTSGNFNTIQGGQWGVIDASSVCNISGSVNEIKNNSNFASIHGGLANKIDNIDNHPNNDHINILGGTNNHGNYRNSTILGGSGARTLRYGEVVSGVDVWGNGDAQGAIQVLGTLLHTHNTSAWQALFLDGVSEQITVRDDSAVTFDILIVGINSTLGEQYHYKIEGSAFSLAGVTTVTSMNVTTLFESVVTYNCRVAAGTNVIQVEVQDSAGSGTVGIRWVMSCRMVEVAFA